MEDMRGRYGWYLHTWSGRSVTWLVAESYPKGVCTMGCVPGWEMR